MLSFQHLFCARTWSLSFLRGLTDCTWSSSHFFLIMSEKHVYGFFISFLVPCLKYLVEAFLLLDSVTRTWLWSFYLHFIFKYLKDLVETVSASAWACNNDMYVKDVTMNLYFIPEEFMRNLSQWCYIVWGRHDYVWKRHDYEAITSFLAPYVELWLKLFSYLIAWETHYFFPSWSLTFVEAFCTPVPKIYDYWVFTPFLFLCFNYLVGTFLLLDCTRYTCF